MSTAAEFNRKLLHDIELYGWHVIKVPKDELGPSYGLSIGLHYTFNHPEILIIGLGIDVIHLMINRIGDAIRDGLTFQPGHFYSNILEKVDCYFTLVDPSLYTTYTGYAQLFYKESSFPVFQCIYPTLDGSYPWEDTWPINLKDEQPVLGKFPDEL